MCTVSIISMGPSAFRLVTNRDDKRTRAGARNPQWRTLANGRAIWPTDTTGGGTWIAANEAGLVLCILNKSLHPGTRLPSELRSRGLILPDLIDERSAHDAIAALKSAYHDSNLDQFAPFRIIACERPPNRPVTIIEAQWDRRGLSISEHETPACFVSSGLGDAKALPRLPLFDQCVREMDPSSQDQFHRHQWADRPEVSVLMSRPDARTLSITAVDVDPSASPRRVRMTFEPIHEAAEAAGHFSQNGEENGC